jgi:NADH:ubiquinone reductase (H+-translocating)
MKKVVIIGGGFAGLSAAKSLAHSDSVHVTLVDKKNYHLFQPLLYQVATAGLSPAEIAYPLRSVIGAAKNVDVIMGEVTHIDKEKKIVQTPFNSLSYDYLIVACGARESYFGKNEWEEFAPSLKTLEQATEIRRRIYYAFEQAERSHDEKERKKCLTFVIVGGGPTGVELAGAIGEITRYTLIHDFKNILPQQTRIILVEAGKTILPSFSKDLSLKAMRDLEELGVQVWTNSAVSLINAEGLQIGEEFIAARTVLWAAGVAANPLNQHLSTRLDRAGRIIVNPDLSIEDDQNIFILGDQAHSPSGKDKTPLPGLAPVAMQQGRYVAKLILSRINGKKDLKPFHYMDKGQMATIGKSKAIAMFKGAEFDGFFAWLAWLLVHIYYLIGFRNRTFVLFSWAWTYLTFRRGARLIVSKEWRTQTKN